MQAHMQTYTSGQHSNDGDSRTLPYPIVMSSSSSNGWYDDIFAAVYYSISDSSRTTLLFAGTYCGSKSQDTCYAQLVDGSYIFRVSGNAIWRTKTHSATWRFCGVTGRRQQEIAFTVSSGRCTAGAVISAHISERLENGNTTYPMLVDGLDGRARDEGSDYKYSVRYNKNGVEAAEGRTVLGVSLRIILLSCLGELLGFVCCVIMRVTCGCGVLLLL